MSSSHSLARGDEASARHRVEDPLSLCDPIRAPQRTPLGTLEHSGPCVSLVSRSANVERRTHRIAWATNRIANGQGCEAVRPREGRAELCAVGLAQAAMAVPLTHAPLADVCGLVRRDEHACTA